MRLIHTADWHLGRRLRGVDRTPEIACALEALLQEARALEVDAVLVAGDLFDSPNPPAEAEKVAYRFFFGLQEAGIPAIVIAGNHDSATRLDGLAELLRLAGVHALGRPRRGAQGGLVRLQTRSGLLAVGAMPFASERRLLSAEELWSLDAEVQRARYRELVAYLLSDLASGFQPSDHRVLLGHLAFDTARLAHSEAAFYTKGGYSLAEALIPPEAQYVALGHIHTPQALEAPSPTWYSGSLIQVDFGEAGEEKGYVLVDLELDRPARAQFRSLLLSRPLKVVSCDLAGLEEALAPWRDHAGYLKVVVSLEHPVLGLADRVRRLAPQALVIEPRYPETPEPASLAPDPSRVSPEEAFERFYADRRGRAISGDLAKVFARLHEEARHAPA